MRIRFGVLGGNWFRMFATFYLHRPGGVLQHARFGPLWYARYYSGGAHWFGVFNLYVVVESRVKRIGKTE